MSNKGHYCLQSELVSKIGYWCQKLDTNGQHQNQRHVAKTYNRTLVSKTDNLTHLCPKQKIWHTSVQNRKSNTLVAKITNRTLVAKITNRTLVAKIINWTLVFRMTRWTQVAKKKKIGHKCLKSGGWRSCYWFKFCVWLVEKVVRGHWTNQKLSKTNAFLDHIRRFTENLSVGEIKQPCCIYWELFTSICAVCFA